MNEIICKFKFRCPKKWEELATTDNDGVKFCNQCNENVFWAESQEEFDQLAVDGKCVGVATATPEMQFIVGESEPPTKHYLSLKTRDPF